WPGTGRRGFRMGWSLRDSPGVREDPAMTARKKTSRKSSSTSSRKRTSRTSSTKSGGAKKSPSTSKRAATKRSSTPTKSKSSSRGTGEHTDKSGRGLRGVSNKEERMYEHIKDDAQSSGRYVKRAKEVAATVILEMVEALAHTRGD